MFRRIISSILIVTFTLTSMVMPSSAQVLPSTSNLPISSISQFPVFKGIKIYPQEPFRFDFLLDEYNSSVGAPLVGAHSVKGRAQDPPLQEESMKLIKYFMASLTVPEGDLWVNLSPYEPDRIIPQALGQTEMGRDLLVQDYILKQLTASLMNPEGETGKKFWEKIYERLYETVGAHSRAPVQNDGDVMQQAIESFNKVWIIPDVVEVYQNGDVAYVVNAKLKVMLEEDYLARDKAVIEKTNQSFSEETKSVIREVIVPIIEQEVNEGTSFANLRQIFHSMILAKWYEQHFKNSVLGQNYVDHNTISGIELNNFAQQKETIYNSYVQAFKKGASDLIKEEYDPVTQGVVTKKYFVGGFNGKMRDLAMLDVRSVLNFNARNFFRKVSVHFQPSDRKAPPLFRNLLVLFNVKTQGFMFLPNILDKIVDKEMLTHQDIKRLVSLTLQKLGENQAEYYWDSKSLGVLKFLLYLHPEHFVAHGEFNYERFFHKIQFTAGLGNFKLNRLYKRMKNQIDHYERRIPGRLYYQNRLTAFRGLTIFKRQQASLEKYKKYFDVLKNLITSSSSGMVVSPIRYVGLEEIGLDWNVAEVKRLNGTYKYFISTTADIAKTTSVWRKVADRLVNDPIVVYGGIQPLFRLEEEEVAGWREMVFPQIDIEIATYAFNTSAAKYIVDILAVSKLIDSLRMLGFEDKQIRIRINNQTGIMAGLLKANGLKIDEIREVGSLLNELSASQANSKDDQEQLRDAVMAKIDYYSKKYMFPDWVYEFFVQAIWFNHYDASLIETDFPYIADLVKELDEKLLILQKLYDGIPVLITIDPTSFRNLSYGSLGIQADVTFDQSKYYAEISGGGCDFSDKPDYYLSGFALGIIRIASLLQEHGLHPRVIQAITEERIKEMVSQWHVSSPYIKSGNIPGSIGDGYKIETEIKVKPGSKKVVIVMHGAGGTRHEPVGELVNHMEGLDASLVRFTTSRQRQLMQSDERSLKKMFGNKTYAQELEDCRRVLKYVLAHSERLLGVPRQELEMVLIGSGAGGVSSVILGAEFPQVKKILLVNSGLTFDHPPKIRLVEGFPPQQALSSALDKFRGSLLSIRGGNNFIVTEQAAKDLVVKAHNGRFVSIPGMRHFLTQTVRGEKMQKLSRLMRSFIDKASLVESKNRKEIAPGGIDLNNLNMQTSGEATTIQVPSDPAMMNQPIQMLVPRIISIGNVNVMTFLGLNNDSPQKPADEPEHFSFALPVIRKDA